MSIEQTIFSIIVNVACGVAAAYIYELLFKSRQ